MKAASWEKAKNIFEQAMAVAPGERGRFLDEVCPDDEIMRREVEELLSSFDETASFLETPAVSKKKNELASGQVFGHYEILRQIGAGGMGEVYLAKDKKLDRRVAIKILNAEFSRHESNLQRFIREAKAASALNHPNILVIHEIGESEEAHFIVSEYIKGKTLREIMQTERRHPDGVPALSKVLDIAIQIAAALVAAHEAHLVHRDIKPENIMLRPDGFVKVLDFGLAKLVEQKNKSLIGLEDEAAKQNNTAKGVILGTVNYMSPEQARGKDTDARSDIWSLGVVVYEMLSGRTPFEGETTNDTIAAILTREPAPLDENTPPELQRVIRKSLQKNADERYQTIKTFLLDVKNLKRELEFAEELERSQIPNSMKASNVGTNQSSENATALVPAAVSTQHSLPQATSSAEYIAQEFKKHKLGVAFGSIILLALIGLGYWYFFNYTAGSKQIESIAVMPFVNKSGNAELEYLSDGMTETLISSLSQLPNLNVKPRSSVFRYKGKETNPQTIAKELNVQAILNGRVVQRGQDISLFIELIDISSDKVVWSETYNRKQSDLITLHSEIARDVSGKIKTKLSGADEAIVTKTYTTNPEAYQLYLKGRYHWNKRTSESLKLAVEFFNQAIEKDPSYALAYSGLAESYVLFPIYSVALPLDSMPKAKAAALRAIELDDSLAETHVALGIYYSNFAWNQPAAEKEFRHAIELNPKYANAHQQFGVECLTAMGRFDEAVAEGKRAEELDPLSPIIGADLSLILIRARRFDEALAQVNRVLTLDPNFMVAYWYLGMAYHGKGQYAEAVAAYRKALAFDDNPLVKALLIRSLARSGKRDEAVKLLDELRSESARRYVPGASLAVAYGSLGEKDKAFVFLDKEFNERASRPKFPFYFIWDDLRDDPRFADLVRRVEAAKLE